MKNEIENKVEKVSLHLIIVFAFICVFFILTWKDIQGNKAILEENNRELKEIHEIVDNISKGSQIQE